MPVSSDKLAFEYATCLDGPEVPLLQQRPVELPSSATRQRLPLLQPWDGVP